MEDFKIGDKIACKSDYGYRSVWGCPEVITRETKSCWITDKGTQVKKDTHSPRGKSGSFEFHRYYLWTVDMELKKQQTLLRRSLEEELSAALKEHRFTVTQLQYIKSMLDK